MLDLQGWQQGSWRVLLLWVNCICWLADGAVLCVAC